MIMTQQLKLFIICLFLDNDHFTLSTIDILLTRICASHYLGPELQGRTELRTRSCLTRGWEGETVRGDGVEARMTPAVLHMSL